jgi:SAM-dependent methyltransferase
MGDVYRAFVGSIPEYYDRYLVPLVFEPYAKDLVRRVRTKPDMRILELACGTGALTALLAKKLSVNGELVASDLNQAMIDVAREKLRDDSRLTWEMIDAGALPFDPASFDAVICQFGWMFFPDRPRALREARRVLRSGGQLIFNTWDSIEQCPVLAAAYAEIQAAFPEDPPRFYDVPFSMFEVSKIDALIRGAGFAEVSIEHVKLEGASMPAGDIATGIIRGGPFVTEIQQRGADVDLICDRVARRLVALFGDRPLSAPMSALVSTATAS